jgi:UDP-3-O-[3-hydroxymyristoyl] N-acetylglucosamine deacetylase
MFAGALCAAVAALMTALKTGNTLLWPCVAVLVVTGALRALDTRQYKKVRSSLAADGVARWEMRYQFGAMLYAAALGAWCLVAVMGSDDAVAHMIATSVTLCYVAAGGGRTYGRPWIFHVQMLLACGPLTFALAANGSPFYVGMALLNVLFFFSLKHISTSLQKIFVIHGEEEQSLAFAETLRGMKPKAEVVVPVPGQKVTLSLKPAPADYGIRFQRADLGGLEIPATVTHLGGIQYQTGLTREAVSVETVEHLLAALTALNIDNVIVELNSPEVPIMDGSAAPFVYLVNEAGVRRLQAPRRYLKVLRPISLTQGDKRIALYPSDHFKVTYSISFDHPLLRHQSRTMRITEDSFVEEIAPARTFGFLKEVEMLRQRGLALGGSLDNAIVLGETGVLNNALRFEDEFVRHKILDVIGDLSLVGHPVVGHLVAHRGGHALHTAFAAKILEEADAWRLVDAVSDTAVGLPVSVPAGSAARLAN